jgi:predicted transcriptional regulator
MRRQNTETIHPGSPHFLRKGQKALLLALGRRPCSMEELRRSLFGWDGTAAQARKLVATLATLMAQDLAMHSGVTAFKLTQAGRFALEHPARPTTKTNRARPKGRARKSGRPRLT